MKIAGFWKSSPHIQRYQKITLGVTNFEKMAVFSRKKQRVFLLFYAPLLSLFCNIYLKRSCMYCYNS